jgi:hypothetical protein
MRYLSLLVHLAAFLVVATLCEETSEQTGEQTGAKSCDSNSKHGKHKTKKQPTWVELRASIGSPMKKDDEPPNCVNKCLGEAALSDDVCTQETFASTDGYCVCDENFSRFSCAVRSHD